MSRSLLRRYWKERLEESYRGSVIDSFEGISLCDFRMRKVPDEFARNVKEALFRIRRHDRRRYQRIQQHVRFIVNMELASGAAYDEYGRACLFDFGRLSYQENETDSGIYLECALVHEATHGALLARGGPYTGRSRLRVEQICHREERRYMSRAYPWISSDDFTRMDEEWLKKYWGFWSRFKLLLRRGKDFK